MDEKKRTSPYRLGLLVFLGLAVLTGIEYALGLIGNMIVPLVIIALVKAGLVVWYYMHIRRVFRPEEGDHS